MEIAEQISEKKKRNISLFDSNFHICSVRAVFVVRCEKKVNDSLSYFVSLLFAEQLVPEFCFQFVCTVARSAQVKEKSAVCGEDVLSCNSNFSSALLVWILSVSRYNSLNLKILLLRLFACTRETETKEPAK